MNNGLCLILGLVAALTTLGVAGCDRRAPGSVVVTPTLEDRTPDGSLYTPATQSFLRGRHWLESIEGLAATVAIDGTARIELYGADDTHRMVICNLQLDQLVPRLHYAAGPRPDDFDAFNLMLAEYARNSISVPVGRPGDTSGHFETDLPEAVPWTLGADYEFEPNPLTRPVRMSLVNNCLRPGLWELSASDGAGEIYHAWFEMPPDLYLRVLATTNGLEPDFALRAVQWSSQSVRLPLERLRAVTEVIGTAMVDLAMDSESGYSTQDSRRKLSKGYVLVERDGKLVAPQRLGELTQHACHLSAFVEPGKYSLDERRRFDLAFLREPLAAEVRIVRPHTRYQWREVPAAEPSGTYLEILLRLRDHVLVLGNLPMDLLVPQQDFAIHGFGVGVLSSDGIAERRQYLVRQGPAPSFAYLCEPDGQDLYGLNSHEYGLEQVFIRTHLDGAVPWWEITITSYERIVDLVKYRVEIPAQLHDRVERYAVEYIAPLYLTYRDDNLR